MSDALVTTIEKLTVKLGEVEEERDAARAESDFHRGQRDAAWEARDKALAELASLRQCSTCCGTPHASGLPCICGGTNKAEDEVKNLRLESMVLRDAVVRIGEDLKYKHDPEFQGAYLAWRGLTDEQRRVDLNCFEEEGVAGVKVARRLLKAAAR